MIKKRKPAQRAARPAKRLSEEEYARQGQRLWDKFHREQAKLMQRAPFLSEAGQAAIVESGVDHTIPSGIDAAFPEFSVNISATQIVVNVREASPATQSPDSAGLSAIVERPINELTPALSTACAEEVRKLIEAVEAEYRKVIDPLCAEIRSLRDELSAGYLGHHNSLAPTIPDLEATPTEQEAEAEIDATEARVAREVKREVTKRLADRGVLLPKSTRRTPATLHAQNEYQKAYNAEEAAVRAERKARLAAASTGMV